jgi:hypothetical protein
VTYLQTLANLLRGLAHHIDPVPPSPVAPEPGDCVQIYIKRVFDPDVDLHGIVEVVRGDLIVAQEVLP